MANLEKVSTNLFVYHLVIHMDQAVSTSYAKVTFG